MSKIKTRSLSWKESFCYDLWLLQLCLFFLLTSYRKFDFSELKLQRVMDAKQNNNLCLTTLTHFVLASHIKILIGVTWLFPKIKYLSLAKTLFSPSQGQYFIELQQRFLFLHQLLLFTDSKGSVLESQYCPHCEFIHSGMASEVCVWGLVPGRCSSPVTSPSNRSWQAVWVLEAR